MVAKKYQSPSGGLNARGRTFFKKKGHNLKPPVTGNPKAGSRAAGRKKASVPEWAEYLVLCLRTENLLEKH